MVCKEKNLVIERIDKNNILSIQNIQKVCEEPVWEASSLFHLLDKGSGYGYLAKQSRNIIGYILLRSLSNEEELLSLGVLKSNRRNGVAKRLFYEVEKDVIKKNIYRIFLEVRVENNAAICFYKLIGFKKVKVLKNYYRADIGYEDGLLFSKVYFDDYKLS